MPGRTTIVKNLKSLHVRLFETEQTSIVTASKDREEVSDTSMTSRLSLLLDQSKVSDTFMKVQLFAAGGEKTAAIFQLHLSRDSVQTIVQTNCPDKSLIYIVQLSGQKCWTILKKKLQLQIRNFETNSILYLKINNKF